MTTDTIASVVAELREGAMPKRDDLIDRLEKIDVERMKAQLRLEMYCGMRDSEIKGLRERLAAVGNSSDE